MSAPEIDLNYLHTTVMRETESDFAHELDPNFYRLVSEFLGNLKKQEYDGMENKIKESMIDTATELVSLLIDIRIAKFTAMKKPDIKNLLDEEKFILDSHEQQHERTETISSAIVYGKSKLLESISQKHKTKLVAVRFLQNIDEFVGADLEKYGPFRAEDIATIPYENAQALTGKDATTKVNWQD